MKYDYAIERLKDLNEGKEMEYKSNHTGKWVLDSNPHDTNLPTLNDPTSYRTKPTPRKVPWGPEDIRSDMWFRHSDGDWHKPTSFNEDGLSFESSPSWAYATLQMDFVYRRDGWPMDKVKKCEKDEATP